MARKGINSNTKGGKTERTVCNLFKAWSNWEFARVPRSGGLNWKNRKDITGDVICTEEGVYWPLSIECKGYAEIDFSKLLYPSKSTIDSFWKQTESDGKKSGKIPMLMMRYNGLPKDFFFVAFDYYFAKEYKPLIRIAPKMVVKAEGNTLLIVPSTELFKLSFKNFYVFTMAKIGRNGKSFL